MSHKSDLGRLIELWIKVPGLDLTARQRDHARHKWLARDAPTALPIGPDLPRRPDAGSTFLLRSAFALAPAAQR